MRFYSLAFASQSLLAPALPLPLAACGDAAVPVEEETPSAEAAMTTPAPVATPTPTATATPAADPHAGHDMSTMSDEQMKAMGHN